MSEPFAPPSRTSGLPLLLRELRRLAPVALTCAAVGLISGLMLVRLGRVPRNEALAIGPLVCALCAAWLLGAASVAPDVETGAQAFLSRLPFGRGRQLATRVGAAAAWLALLLAGACAVLACRAPGPPQSDMAPSVLLGVGLVFPASVLASVVAGRGLTAVGLAPLLAALPLAYALLASGLGAPAWLAMPLAGVAVPATLLAALAAFVRAFPTRASMAPGGVAGAVLAGGAGVVVLGVGAGRVHAEMAATTHTSHHPLAQERGLWARLEYRVVPWPADVRRPAEIATPRAWLVRADDPLEGPVAEPGTPLQLPGGATRVDVLDASPDGERALCAVQVGDEERLVLFDRAGAALAEALVVPSPGGALWGPLGSILASRRGGCAWVEGEPWLVGEGVARSPSRGALRLPDGHAVLGAGGEHVALRRVSDGALALWRPGDAPPRVVTTGEGVQDAVLSPGGRLLVVVRDRGLEVHDLAGGAVVAVDPAALPLPPWTEPAEDPAAPSTTSGVDVVYAPREGAVWLGLDVTDPQGVTTTTRAVLVDVQRRTWRAVPAEYPGVWSPGGRRHASPRGWVDLDEPTPQARPLDLPAGAHLAFDGEDALRYRVADRPPVRIALAR